MKAQPLGQACKYAIIGQVALMLFLVFFNLLQEQIPIAILICISVHWLAVAWIVIRRRKNPQRSDFIFARSGFLIYLLLLIFGAIAFSGLKRML